MGLAIYLLFMVSWFLHLPARFPVLGAIRFDLLLVLILAGMTVGGWHRHSLEEIDSKPMRLLWTLVLYILATIPFVEWPGSVVRYGVPEFIKAFVFFVFTIRFVRTTNHLKILLGVSLGCQIFRVIEPLYLHWTEGYWGSRASMSGWESMNRLSGAPLDIINPNGLAFVCLSVLPFLYFYMLAAKKLRIILLPMIFTLLYAMFLTGSRSGFIGLLVVILAVAAQAKKAMAKVYIPVIFIALVVIGYNQLGVNFQDRYASIFDEDARNAGTFEGRIQGMKDDFLVALNRPVFGHGLGTSAEANFNIRGGTRRSHNLFAEISQELGFVGLAIFTAYILSLLRAVRSLKAIQVQEGSFLDSTNKALGVWFWMNLVFSIASYGLSGYQWYLFGAMILKAREFSTAREVRQEAAPASEKESPALTEGYIRAR